MHCHTPPTLFKREPPGALAFLWVRERNSREIRVWRLLLWHHVRGRKAELAECPLNWCCPETMQRCVRDRSCPAVLFLASPPQVVQFCEVSCSDVLEGVRQQWVAAHILCRTRGNMGTQLRMPSWEALRCGG